MSTNKDRFVSKTILSLASLLLSLVAVPVIPAKADAELDALQARLAEAQKENIRLKAERLEQENARLRAEADVFKARSKPSAPVALGAASTRAGKPRSGVAETHAASIGHTATDGLLNAALGSIPKDDPRREMTAAAHVIPVSTVSPVVGQWSGVYAGFNAGFGTGEIDNWSSGPAFSQSYYGSGSSYRMLSGSTIYNGPTVGGQIGYNYEFSNKVVLGVETDMDYADISDKVGNSSNGSNITIYPFSFDSFRSSQRTGIDWLGTTRLRLGYDLGIFMPYLTGGLAYGAISNESFSSQASGYAFFSPNQAGSSNISSNSSVQLGWGAGAGAELKVADHWSIRGEYLYTRLGSLSAGSGSSSFYTCSNCFGGSSGAGWSYGSIGPFGIHQARVGLNYYTGWGASPTLATLK